MAAKGTATSRQQVFAILAYIAPTINILNQFNNIKQVALTDSHCEEVTSLEEDNYLPMIVK